MLGSVPFSIRTMVGNRAYKTRNGAYKNNTMRTRNKTMRAKNHAYKKPCVQKAKRCVQNARFETVRFVKTVRFPSPCGGRLGPRGRSWRCRCPSSTRGHEVQCSCSPPRGRYNLPWCSQSLAKTMLFISPPCPSAKVLTTLIARWGRLG